MMDGALPATRSRSRTVRAALLAAAALHGCESEERPAYLGSGAGPGGDSGAPDARTLAPSLDGGVTTPPRLDASVQRDAASGGADAHDSARDAKADVSRGVGGASGLRDASLEASGADGDSGAGGGTVARDATTTPDASDAPDGSPPPIDANLVPDAAPVAPPSLGPGFTELIGPIEETVPLIVPPQLTFGGGGIPTIGIFRDMDGDGADEVVLSAPENRDVNWILEYDAVGGALAVRESLDVRELLTLADVDGDGRQDAISRTNFPVGWGLGGGAFGGAQQVVFGQAPIDVVVDDLDRDGWLDVIGDEADLADPRDFVILLRNGTRSFADRSALVPVVARTCPTGVMIGELVAGENILQVFGGPCGNDMTVSGMYRETGLDARGFPLFAPFDPLPANLFFARAPGQGLTSRAPMGGAIGDLDDDGFPELSITFNPATSLFGGNGAYPLTDRTMETGFAYVPGSATDSDAIPWGIAFVDVDQDGREDVITAFGNDYTAWVVPSFYVGRQPTTLFWNVDGTRFLDVTEAAGVGRLGQWKALAVGDLENDGDADFIVGGQAELPRVYRNDIVSGNHGFSLRLHGTSSNHYGLGARVDVTVADGGRVQRYLAGGLGSPLAFSEPLVFVGLGAATTAHRVRIVWPSGTVQELADLAAGTLHHVVEPALFELNPASRHAPADGTSEVVVVISPRDARGNVAQGTAVTVSSYGMGTVSAPTPRGDGTYEVRVTAPVTAGSTALRIFLDGVEAGVRPRIFWD